MWRGAGNRKASQEVRDIPLEKIRTGAWQPRFAVREDDLEGLTASINQVGLLQPVLVRPLGDSYELVAGERRLRACAKAGLKTVPAVVRQLSDAEAAEAALVENLQRRNLHFFEEAEGYARLIREHGLTQEQVAQRVGLGQSTIANKLRLLGLEEDLRSMIYDAGLSERHARALLEIGDHAQRRQALSAAVERGMTVRDWEHYLKRENNRIISREINRSRKRLKPLIKDLRLFMNSLERGVETLRAAGMNVRFHQQRDDSGLRVEIEVETDAGGS